MTISALIIIAGIGFIFRKTLWRVSEVTPEVASIAVENVHRMAVVADEHVALSALTSHMEATKTAAKLAEDHNLKFQGDIIDLYEETVQPHDYTVSRISRKADKKSSK